jgi:hypothetical protein
MLDHAANEPVDIDGFVLDPFRFMSGSVQSADSRRPVSPHLPLLPYVTLSASYGGRLEVSFNLSASLWHPQDFTCVNIQ